MKKDKTIQLLFALSSVIIIALVALPSVVALKGGGAVPVEPVPFPVSVDPESKTILERPTAELPLTRSNTLVASALSGADMALGAISKVVIDAPAYQLLASAMGPKAVVIYAGMRREQVALEFGSVLGWTKAERDEFLNAATSTTPEGTLYPSTYVVPRDISPTDARLLIYERFNERILSRYTAEVEAQVPLKDALIIASLIERETADQEEMHIISGILWNRLFQGMRLQVDATLQYVRGTSRNGWWPVVRPRDKFLKSPFNTYQSAGLPPAPIASPSVAAVVAALNPARTQCMFYFHDRKGGFHCSKTYLEHVDLLKKAYGRGR